MATVTLYLDGGVTADLTTEHAASSYGRPVLVIDGQAYGPGDPVPSMHRRLAHHMVATSVTMWEHNHPTYDPIPGEPDAREEDEETRIADDLRARFAASGSAVALGRRGGQAKSPAKTAAVRANARKPRPRPKP